LLLDEPLAALDAVTKARIVDDLRAWNNRHRIPILYVTHVREEVFTFADNVIVLERGRVVAQGSPHDVLSRPQSETVAQLAGFENIFESSAVASHPEQGTMTCRISGSALQIEVPLSRIDPAQPFHVGIRAGDILLASIAPQGLSARNVLYGSIISVEQRDMTVIAKVDCGAEFEVHLTLGARQSLRLERGAKVWLVVKTYSCHVLQQSSSCPIRPDSQTI
jgi:molybdate transport system ATP-binding protein